MSNKKAPNDVQLVFNFKSTVGNIIISIWNAKTRVTKSQSSESLSDIRTLEKI